MKKDKILSLADLLPDNLDEDTLNKIAESISSFINAEVKERIKLLEAKTLSFIRGNIELLKEQAQAELKDNNEVYQDAMQFRKLKDLMGLNTKIEVKEQDDINALKEENETLVEHLNHLVEELTKTKSLKKKYKNAFIELSEQTEQLDEQVQVLKDEKKPFKSSEKALMLSEERLVGNKKESQSDNPYLTEEVLAAMPES